MKRRIAIFVLALIAAGGCASNESVKQPIPQAARQQEMERLREVTRSSGGDAVLGQQVFLSRCANCHTVFGQGGNIGPDLTPYLRREEYRDLLLTSLLNPSGPAAEIHAIRTLTLKDGTTHTGVLIEDATGQLILAVPGGNRVTLAKSAIDMTRTTTPQTLLAGLSDQQVRNLFAYLLREAPARR